MSIAGIKNSSYDNSSIRMPSQDRYENDIRKQITQLEDKMNNISNDEEKTTEQKTKEKQAAQEQIQNLNNELRKYEMKKRQKEAEEKQEAVKQALEEANASRNPDPATSTGKAETDISVAGLADHESGVMITLSTTQEQLAGMVRIRKNLEGQQRTADTEEEKAAIQKKITYISRGIGQKAMKAKNAISEYHKTVQSEDTKKPAKTDSKKDEVFWTDTKPVNQPVQKTINADTSKQNKPFDDISVVIRS